MIAYFWHFGAGPWAGPWAGPLTGLDRLSREYLPLHRHNYTTAAFKHYIRCGSITEWRHMKWERNTLESVGFTLWLRKRDVAARKMHQCGTHQWDSTVACADCKIERPMPSWLHSRRWLHHWDYHWREAKRSFSSEIFRALCTVWCFEIHRFTVAAFRGVHACMVRPWFNMLPHMSLIWPNWVLICHAFISSCLCTWARVCLECVIDFRLLACKPWGC